MEMKCLDLAEVFDIYDRYAIHDFPASELKTKDHIKDLMTRGLYRCFGFYQQSQLVAYAWFFVYEPSLYLLDFFAVLAAFRSQGLGAQILQLLREQIGAHGVYGEVEDPDYAIDSDDRSIRQRRIGFYLRNGMHLTGVRSSVLTDRYLIFCSEPQPDDIVRQHVRQLYQTMFDEAFYQKHIIVQ